eukprot:jgi/Antlo1/2064/245
MKVVMKDLPKHLDTEKFVTHLRSKHTVNAIDFLRTRGVFRRVAFLDVPVEQCKAFVRYHNNSYYERVKIRCEVHRKIVFEAGCEEEALKRCGRVESIERGPRSVKVTFSKLFLDTLFDEVEKKTLRMAKSTERRDEKDMEYFNTLFFDFQKVLGKHNRAEVLAREAGVRVAYLEAELVNRTRTFLESNAIYLDGLTGERSKTELIVRDFNVADLPAECETKIAPSETVALLKFCSERDAMRCFKRMEKAEFLPLSTKPGKVAATSTKLVVKNVPFQADAQELRKLFQTKAQVKAVRIPVKRNKQSRGFAFVECASREDAQKILEWFGVSTHLYGRRLVIEQSAERIFGE